MKDSAQGSLTARLSEEHRGQAWDAAAYAANGRFVATLASETVAQLAPRPGERILDLGCGDGALTEQLAATGAILAGVDASAAMVEAARARGLRIDHHDATALPYQNEFDAVFSNAALHWIRDAKAVLAGVHRALRPGGRFVAEMGGQGNIAAIRVALQSVLAPFGIDAEETAASFFPSPAHYRRLLEETGFTVRSIELIPRPTPLPAGMENWRKTFRNGVLDRLPEPNRASAIQEIVRLLRPVLADQDGTGPPTTSAFAFWPCGIDGEQVGLSLSPAATRANTCDESRLSPVPDRVSR